MSRWQTFFEELYTEEVPLSRLPHPGARALAELLASEIYTGAKLFGARAGNAHFPDACLLFINVDVALGQRKLVNAINAIEPMAIVYSRIELLPSVYALREDFPEDVPHLNLTMKDCPRSLCLFEMPTEEAIRIATPFVLVEQVRMWLKETAYGRLHGDDQPLDPIFLNGCQPIVLPRVPMDQGQNLFRAFRVSDHSGFPTFVFPVVSKEDETEGQQSVMAVLMIATAALPHARLRMVPINIAELVEAYNEMGIDVLHAMQTGLRTWPGKPELNALIHQKCLLVIRTPIERSAGRVDGEAAKAFITECTAGVFAEKIGAFWENEGFAAPLIGVAPPELSQLADVKLHPMDVHRSLDRSMAQSAAGLAPNEHGPIAVTLVGAGAVGSQIALTAARMGLGVWSVVDPDHLLPHNMARHGLSIRYLGRAKADALAEEIEGILGVHTASGIVARASDPASQAALSSAALVIDAAASVSVSRWLSSDVAFQGRAVSVFLNPKGTHLVILLEGEERRPRLDHVEMAYYWGLISGSLPKDHFADGRVGLFPSGGCRVPSLAIAQANIGALAPFAVKRLLQSELPAAGLVEVREVADDGVKLFSCQPRVYREAPVAEWTACISVDVLQAIATDRLAAGELETGGILVGTWDRIRKRVYVVGYFDPPPDSVAEATGFTRGSKGVYETIETVQRLTAGNLTYIGEWHTHPRGMRSTPSSDDRILMRWIEDVLKFSDAPAIMLIAGKEGVRAIIDAEHYALFIATS